MTPKQIPEITRQRRSRMQAALEHAPFDAALLTTPESILYATGFPSVGASVFTDYLMGAVVSPTEVCLIVGASEVAAALDSGIQPDELVAYGQFFFEGDRTVARFNESNPDYAAAVKTAISRVVKHNWRLAVESPNRTSAVQSGAVDSRTIDATAWTMSVRAVKLPSEHEVLRAAVTITEDAIRAGIDAIAAGVTERDIARVVARTMAQQGGTPRFVVVTSGERSALSDAFASDRVIRPGDLVRFDIGCIYDGYWSDIARTAVVGAPTARQARYYAALRDGLAAEVASVRPGMTAGELFALTTEAVESAGLAGYRRHHVGHAIGLSVYERPIISANAPTVLEEGMVFCLETPYYELGWGGMMIEDAGVLTNTGFDMFTTLDRDLTVVP